MLTYHSVALENSQFTLINPFFSFPMLTFSDLKQTFKIIETYYSST